MGLVKLGQSPSVATVAHVFMSVSYRTMQTHDMISNGVNKADYLALMRLRPLKEERNRIKNASDRQN